MRANRETACDAQVLGTDVEDRRADYGYTFAGTPAAALPKIKEGTLVTVYYGPSDGFFIRIEIGVKK